MSEALVPSLGVRRLFVDTGFAEYFLLRHFALAPEAYVNADSVQTSSEYRQLHRRRLRVPPGRYSRHESVTFPITLRFVGF